MKALTLLLEFALGTGVLLLILLALILNGGAL